VHLAESPLFPLGLIVIIIVVAIVVTMEAANKISSPKKWYDTLSIRRCEDGTLHEGRLELITWSYTLVLTQMNGMSLLALRL
jgi:hypothetical protein